jgi:hypothetical protein
MRKLPKRAKRGTTFWPFFAARDYTFCAAAWTCAQAVFAQAEVDKRGAAW